MAAWVEDPITRSTLAETIWIRLEDALVALEEEGSEDLVAALVAALAAA